MLFPSVRLLNSYQTELHQTVLMKTVRYLPEWLPGTQFKRTAKHWKQTFLELGNKPYAFVCQQMAEGTNEPSYVSKIHEKANSKLSPEEEFVAKWSAASLYSGGADTVSSVLFNITILLCSEDLQLGSADYCCRLCLR
jgi:hypothetical protein